MPGLFDLDEGLSKVGDGRYEQELRKAKLHIFREEYDKAIDIYDSILSQDMEVLDAYIGLVRAYSKDYTILEGEKIDKNIRIITKMFDDVDDMEFLAYVKKKGSAQRDAEERRAEEERLVAKEREEAEKRKFSIHINLGGRWEDLALKNDGNGNFSLKNLELRNGYLFKINLNGDWRGHNDLKLSLAANHNFSSDATMEQNIVVRSDGVYDLYVSQGKDEFGDYAGKSIWIERSDASLRAQEDRELLEAKQKEEAERAAEEERLAPFRPFRFEQNGQNTVKVFGRQENGLCDGWIVIPEKDMDGNSVTEIGDDAFNLCEGLKCVSIPKGVKRIGKSAFGSCHNLSSIMIPYGVEIIDEYAFEYCSNLGAVSLNSGLKIIGQNAFEHCERIPSLTIPDTVTSIGDEAFSCCEKLARVTLSKNIKSIGYGTFGNCESLKSIDIPKGVTSIGERAFIECVSLESVSIPDTVTSIGESAFDVCHLLRDITIPNGVTHIGDYAFDECESLRSLTLPKSLQRIGEDVFFGCPDLVLKAPQGLNVGRGPKEVIYY